MNKFSKLLLCAVLLPQLVSGQEGLLLRTVPTLDQLELRKPLEGDTIEVLHGSRTNTWPAPLTFTYTTNSSETPYWPYVRMSAWPTGRFVSPARNNPVQDMRYWGAISGDGFDDSTNLQVAINYAAGGKTVFIPVGDWQLNFPITLPYDYQEFDGGGFNANLIVAHNGNGFQHFGVTNGVPRRYNIIFRNIRMTTAAGFTPQAAFRMDDVSYTYWDYVYVTQGAGVGFDNAIKSYGHYDLGTAIYGGNWGLQIANCQMWNKAGGDFVIRGDGGPGSTGGPNDIKILNSYVSGGLSGSPSNGAAGAVFLQNCNMVRVENCDFEQYSTNGVWIGTNVQSASILNNRFENQGGTTATRRLIHFDDYTTQGHVVMGNMMLIQGGGGSVTRISGPGDSKRIPASIIDPSFEGPGQLFASTWLVGINLDGVLRDYGPYGNKLFVMDRSMGSTNIIGVAIIDGTNNPRASIVLKDSGDGTGTNSRVNFEAASSRASLPVYFVGNITNAVITASGMSILGIPDTANALTAYGSGMFGPVPDNPYIDGWTTISNLLGIRSADTSKVALFAGTIDGGENRRVQIIEDPVGKTVDFNHGYTTGGGTTRFIVGLNTVFYLTDSLLTINTNLTIVPTSGLTLGGEYVTDLSGTNLIVAGGKLSVLQGPGSGLDADLLNSQNGAYYLARANHTGTQSYTTITGLGDFALVNYPASDGNTYGIRNGAWTIVTNSGGGGGSTNGSSIFVDGGYNYTLNITNSTKIDPSLSGTNLSFNVVPNSLQTNDIDVTFRTFITSQAGTTYGFTNGVTNNGGIVSGNYFPGANITFTTNAGAITVAASTGSTNSGTPLSVDGTLLSQANLADGSKIAVTASGTNVTYDIVGFSLTTNDITAAFFNWIDSQGGGTGGDVWAASNNVFTMTNTFLGPLIANVLQVTNIILINPIGVTAVGTNVADAQDELQLTPGTYTMAWDQDLQQLAKIDWTNGVMAWHNSTNITNITSTALGRSMLAMSSTNNGRDILQVGGLNQAAYSAAWATVTNMTPTLKDVYTKIESLPGGSNNISSWNSNYFSVTGGYLDWVGGSTGGGSGGVDWIGAYGVGSLTNGHISTNIVLADFAITTNKVPTVDGRYLEGSAELALTNTTGVTVSFNFIAQVNGTPILRAARSLASAATLDLHGIKAKLVRESSTVASFYALGERQGAAVPTIGQGSFGASGGDTLLLATNIAFNWGQSNTLTWLINIDQTSGAVNLTNTGVQRYSAALYNPGSGGSGSSGVSNFTVNGVSFLGPIITNTATVTIATNANGHLEFTAVGGGSGAGTNFVLNGILKQPAIITNNLVDTGRVMWYTNASGHILAYATNLPASGGSSTNILVNGTLVTQANLINGSGITFSVAGSNIQPTVTNNFGSGYANGFLPLYAGIDNALTGDLHFSKVTTDIRQYMREEGMLTETEYRPFGFRANGGVFSIGTSATNDVTWNEDWITFDPSEASWTTNLITFQNPDFTYRVEFQPPVEFGEDVRFSNDVLIGSTNLASALANKQGLNSVLTTVAGLSGGTSTNFFAGDGTFKQVTTNMIPGLNAALAAAGGTPSTRYLFSAFAKDFVSGTNAAAQALDYVSGNGRRMAAFSPSTDNERLFEGVIPPNANLAGGLKITLHFSSTNTGGSNVVWQLQLAPGTSVDPTSTTWNTAVKMTNTFPGSIAITNGSLNYADLAGITNRQPIIGRILRNQGSASDTETGNAFVRAVVLEILDSN